MSWRGLFGQLSRVWGVFIFIYCFYCWWTFKSKWVPWSNEECLKVFKWNILVKSHKYFRNYQSPLPLPRGHEHIVEKVLKALKEQTWIKEWKSQWKSLAFQLYSLFYFMMQFLLKCKKNCVAHNSDFEETSVSFYFPKIQRLERQGFRELSPPTSISGNSEALWSSSAVTALNHTHRALMDFTCPVPFFSSYDRLSSFRVM